MRTIGCLLLFVPSLAMPSATADKTKTEMRAFQGEWRLTGLEIDGKQANVPDGDDAKVVFKGDRLFAGGEQRFTFKLDPSCNPKLIDLIPHQEQDREQVLEGIYRFRGTQLTLCLRNPSRVRMRPVKFGEEDSMVFTLERTPAE